MKKNISLDTQKVLSLVSEKGILCQLLKGFQPRKPQQSMMQNVIEAYNDDAIALIEAGTGTGKSLAYLLPALLWSLEHQQRTVISTHTIALQQQLIEKDIPQLTKALNLNIKAVLVKGMGNYLCLRKFHELKHELLLFSPEERREYESVEAWTESTKEGSRSTLPMTPSAGLWERICAESDTCTHNQCPHYQECFFFKARRHAEEAQIIVANHHLLFADLDVRAESDNYDEPAILPVYSRVIIDEAHHIEDIATDFFGEQVSRTGLLRLLGRIASEKQGETRGKLTSIHEKLQQCFPNSHFRDLDSLFSRFTFDLPNLRSDLQQQITETFNAIEHAVGFFNPYSSEDPFPQGESKLRLLATHHEMPVWQTQILPLAKRLKESIESYTQSLRSLENDLASLDHVPFQEQSKSSRLDIMAFAARLEEQAFLLEKLVMHAPQQGKVRWIEIQRHYVTLRDAELDISKPLVDSLFSRLKSVILCSATLTTNREFHFMRKRLGLLEDMLPEKKITENLYDSPFNYAEQAMFLLPRDLPSPLEGDFIQKATEQIWQAILASHGGTFILFTSYTMLQTCYDLLHERLKRKGYQTFKQGDQERRALLSQFKANFRSVLFGTDSFWEGIDVAGEALRCVIIVKLPFKVPTEPIIQARTEAILANGGHPFEEYTLPMAIVKFKQGVGRLIRDSKDRGCIVCLDTRLTTKKYGQLFLNSLPPCQQSLVKSEDLEATMRAFYRRTHHLVK